MAKRKNRSKRSLGSLPKGIPHKPQQKRQPSKLAQAVGAVNPFEVSAGQKRPKHQVHNRFISTQKTKTSLEPLKRRSQIALQQSLQRSKKANVFVDKRIGEYDRRMTPEEQNLARLVRERSRRSKKSAKFSLQDDDDDDGDDGLLQLTHRGKAIDDETAANAILMSDDEDDEGQLDAMDTALHFGGGSLSKSAAGPYGPSGEGGSMAANYSQRKTELDDLILRRKMLKAEKMKAKEQQEEVIADLDDNFKELASMLNFRDKEKYIRKHIKDKREGNLDDAAKEMEDWDQEIREYSFMGKRAKATDRTKTPEEIAKEQAEELHEKETRRMARMNGDFSDDDFSDVSDDEEELKRSKKRRKTDKKKKKNKQASNPDELDSSDDEDNNDAELKAKFTSEGLVYVNKKGEIVKRVGEAADDQDEDDAESSAEDSAEENSESDEEEEEDQDPYGFLKIGARVQGNYRAKEQFQDREHWYDGVISKVNEQPDGTVTYNVDYDDGDFEEDVERENVRPIEMSKEEKEKEALKRAEDVALKRKRMKAKEKAR